jgi:hypothetical protein
LPRMLMSGQATSRECVQCFSTTLTCSSYEFCTSFMSIVEERENIVFLL